MLKAFHPPPHSSEAEAELHLLCPVQALAMYVPLHTTVFIAMLAGAALSLNSGFLAGYVRVFA